MQGEAWKQVTGMTAGIGIWISHFQPKPWSSKQSEVGCDYKLSKPALSNALPPARLYRLPKQCHQLERKSLNTWAYESQILFLLSPKYLLFIPGQFCAHVGTLLGIHAVIIACLDLMQVAVAAKNGHVVSRRQPFTALMAVLWFLCPFHPFFHDGMGW